MASAVVTDVGGPLSHSSIVAREYGIPAVLGTGVATGRIKSGDTIIVDGSSGTVLLPQDHDNPIVQDPADIPPDPTGRTRKIAAFAATGAALTAGVLAIRWLSRRRQRQLVLRRHPRYLPRGRLAWSGGHHRPPDTVADLRR